MSSRPARIRGLRAALLTTTLLVTTACSPKKMAVNAVADVLSSDSTSSFATDDDLDLVGDATPFALKLMESILQQTPEHTGLLQALCSGYTQYATVWVLRPAEDLKYDDFDGYQAGQTRSHALFVRARDYGLGSLELLHPGTMESLYMDPEGSLSPVTAEQVPLLYWTGAAWLMAVSTSLDDVASFGELPIATAMIRRALELDEDWDRGSLHEVMISLETALPMPGGADRARTHFERAVELSGGLRASPYVSLASSVSVSDQKRDEFEQLLRTALEVDIDAHPPDRLANAYAQDRARFLVDHIDDLFIE
jgi:predicted anti-sigma-YlaC factor YlaD